MRLSCFLLLLGFLAGLSGGGASGQTYVTPMMGGGQSAADMVHIDLLFDSDANQMHAQVDDSFGTPELRPLDPAYAFDPAQPYGVLKGKAYNAQYGWNVGGFFSLPPGTAIWIELQDCSPGLETYSGWGRLAAYTPILGTAGSSRLWKWSGVMVHNTYAVLNPATEKLYALYHVYLGDAETGSRSNYLHLDDATVRLEWTATPVEQPQTFKFGALATTNGAPLSFLNAERFMTNSLAVINLAYTNAGPAASRYAASLPMLVVPATAENGGPATNHAALGSRLALEFVSLQGPPSAFLEVRGGGKDQPLLRLLVGTPPGPPRLDISPTNAAPEGDPFIYLPDHLLSVSEPGFYCLEFRLVDTGAQQPGGQPVHVPSPRYQVFLQAGTTIHTLVAERASVSVSFGGETGKTFFLERSGDLRADGSWQTVAGPLAGTNYVQTLSDAGPGASLGFYRLRTQ